MRCRLRLDGRKKILVVSNSFEQVRLERAKVAEVLDRQSVNAVSDRVLQVVHVEGQLVDEHVRAAKRIENVRAPVDVIDHFSERTYLREVSQVGPRAEAERRRLVS